MIKIGISEKIKILDNKIKQNNDHYNLDRQAPKILLYRREMLLNMNFGSKKILTRK